jgi:imidazoleglycerol-phosphate dehydratase
MKNRTARIERKTIETDIFLTLNLDGNGQGEIQTGIGFFDHLLDAFKKHSLIDISLTAKGDLHIDGHHTVEDVGICLGKAFYQALSDKKGINRFGHAYCPLDEALSRSVVDISGRGHLVFDSILPLKQVGDFAGELFVEFLRAFALQAQITMHVSLLSGNNQHHAMESLIKSLARALRMAIAMDDRQTGIPSTKGMLE